MRDKFCDKVEAGRVTTGDYASPAGVNWGAFQVRAPKNGRLLRVIAGVGDGWDHVSVSLPDRCPTWDEMCAIKHLFFRDDEWVVQYHPAAGDHINNHPHCLHLWSPHDVELPKPPKIMV